MTDTRQMIVELTGPDWEPFGQTKWYAQRGQLFDFGATELEAVQALLALEAKEKAK